MDNLVCVYVIAHRNDDGWAGPCKVGLASDPKVRLTTLQSGNPRPIGLYGFVRTPDRMCARAAEKYLHRSLKASRLHGEWFHVEPEIALQQASLFVCASAHWSGLDAGAALEAAQELTIRCHTESIVVSA